MKLLILISTFFWADCFFQVTSFQSFKCNEGENFNSSVGLKILYTSSIAQCGSMCKAASCPTFAYIRNTGLCSFSDNFYGSYIPDPLSTRCYIQPAPVSTPAPLSTSAPDSTPAPLLTSAPVSTPAPPPAGPTALPGDTGAQCNLNQQFELYVQSTGATFHCCHGWEYKYITHRDLEYYPTILAQDCRFNCDSSYTCYSFVYYGNTSCQLSTCNDSPVCIKANVTTSDAIWCYYNL